MRVVVPSMGRSFDVRTIEALSNAGLRPLVVVPAGEAKDYLAVLPDEEVVEHPKRVKGISKVRQWIMETVEDESLVMVDDDLSFHVRRTDDPTKFLPAAPKDIRAMFKAFEKNLRKYAHVSIVGRQGGNRVLEDRECSRPWHVFGFNKAKFEEAGVAFGSGLLQDDFDITLQLLRKGYPNLVMAKWAANQHHGHGAPGGAACYRTVEDHNASVEKLRSRHPEFVTLKEKEYKGDPWLGRRMEATIQWKKAYRSSQEG